MLSPTGWLTYIIVGCINYVLLGRMVPFTTEWYHCFSILRSRSPYRIRSNFVLVLPSFVPLSLFANIKFSQAAVIKCKRTAFTKPLVILHGDSEENVIGGK